jgi:hypothetical protein
VREGIQGPLANCSLFSQTVFLARWTVGARRSASPPSAGRGTGCRPEQVAARHTFGPDCVSRAGRNAFVRRMCIGRGPRRRSGSALGAHWGRVGGALGPRVGGALGPRWGRTGAASEAHWGRVGGAPDQTCGLIAVHREGPYHLPAVLLGRPSSRLLLSRRFPWRERQGWRGAVHAAGGGPRGGATSSAGRDGPRTTQSPGDATPPGPGSFVLLGSTTAAERATASSSCGDARSTWPAGRSPPQEPPQPQ